MPSVQKTGFRYEKLLQLLLLLDGWKFFITNAFLFILLLKLLLLLLLLMPVALAGRDSIFTVLGPWLARSRFSLIFY